MDIIKYICIFNLRKRKCKRSNTLKMYFPSDYRLSPSINASMDRQTHTRQNYTNQKKLQD